MLSKVKAFAVKHILPISLVSVLSFQSTRNMRIALGIYRMEECIRYMQCVEPVCTNILFPFLTLSSQVLGVLLAISWPTPGVAVGTTTPRGANCSNVEVTCQSPVQ